MRILLFIPFLWCISSLGQNIPNGGFESWEVRDHYQLDWWNTTIRNVKRTNQAADGKFGLMLYNSIDSAGNSWSGRVQSIDYKNLNKLNGFPFTDGPLSLVFWNKHNLHTGDTAQISAVFKEKGKTIGAVSFDFFGDSREDYLKYSVPIRWYYPSTPDSVWIYMKSSKHSFVSGEGYVIFDDVHFEFAGSRLKEIPNASFEDWTNVGIEFPTTWKSVDLQLYDDHSVFLDGQSVFQVTGPQAFDGESSIMIKNYNHFGVMQSGYAYVGTSSTHLSFKAFDVDEAYKYVEGYYKYLTVTPDSGRLLYRSWDGNFHSSYDNFYFQPTKTWTYFKLPVRYSVQHGIPEKASLSVWSSNHYPVDDLNSELYLDNLRLTNQPTSISHLASDNSINVYPNPSSSFLYYPKTTSLVKAVALNSLGQRINLSLSPSGIDISELSNGVYLLYLYRDDTFFSKAKFIKR